MVNVIKYNCPECGYSKVPTNHRPSSGSCQGRVIQVGDTWRCDACDTEITGDTVCAQCGHNLGGIETGPNQKVVDMQL